MKKSRLENIMNASVVTDEKLAEMTGISIPSIWSYRVKGVQPSLAKAKLIADSLMVSLDYLAGGDFDDKSVKFKRKDIINLLHHLNKLTRDDISFLSKILLPYVRKTLEKQEAKKLLY
jgi:transcriptional regulator with XRE-family HTH domain